MRGVASPWLGALGTVGYGLMEAQSSTGDLTSVAIVATAVLLAGYGPVTRRFIRTASHRVTAALAAVAFVIAAYLGIRGALGQDLFTFADRTPLWSGAVAVAHEQPIGGFGYGAVWLHPWKLPADNDVLAEIWDRSGAPLVHGHNSAIDLLVEVGYVGVLLMVVLMVSVGLRSLALVRMREPGHIDDTIMARFIVLCLVSLVLFGITEPMATIPLGWWTLVLLAAPPRVHGRNGGNAKGEIVASA
jgi:exopolysaccharide production protein ExoQ